MYHTVSLATRCFRNFFRYLTFKISIYIQLKTLEVGGEGEEWCLLHVRAYLLPWGSALL